MFLIVFQYWPKLDYKWRNDYISIKGLCKNLENNDFARSKRKFTEGILGLTKLVTDIYLEVFWSLFLLMVKKFPENIWLTQIVKVLYFGHHAVYLVQLHHLL